MANLRVEYIDKVFDDDDSLLAEGSWCVTDPLVILHGFKRRKDAEIALRFLEEFDIDYSLPSGEFWEQFTKYGMHSREAVRERACERLQW